MRELLRNPVAARFFLQLQCAPRKGWGALQAKRYNDRQ